MELRPLLVLLFLFLFFPIKVYASGEVIVNEFYSLGDPDWVEIYNTTSQAKSLEGWVIKDSTDSNTISLSGSICAYSTRKFDFSNKLNNSGDTIRIFETSSTTTTQDSITYFSDSIPEHQTNQSTSRTSDGGSNWAVQTSPTPNDNQSCNPQPTPTPTPTPTPNPSPTPTPTPNPSPSATPTAGKSPSPKAIATSTPEVQNQQSILGQSDSPESPSPSPSPKPESGGLFSKAKAAALISGAGAILIALSIGFYLWYSKILGKEKEEEIQKVESQV